ncbi:MAG: vitamin B12 dependent-methionine synthase activation domain-containing protein [Candidatus Aceula meridiana]|nr:vitamin B12 dependent-methionine synthase activation domain-containing protein [Candidatus Aceula meridiana]
MNVKLFKSISIEPNKNNIYRHLGYSKEKTEVHGVMRDQVDCYIDDSLSVIDLKGVAEVLTVKKADEERIELEGDIIFKSKGLAQFLKGSNEVLLMATTAGTQIMEEIQKNSSSGDLVRSVIYDATAGEMVDDALTWIMNYYKGELVRKGKQLDPRRFSCGYGDFALEEQKIFWDILKMKDLGVQITDSYLLVPEKSVTAITGIR